MRIRYFVPIFLSIASLLTVSCEGSSSSDTEDGSGYNSPWTEVSSWQERSSYYAAVGGDLLYRIHPLMPGLSWSIFLEERFIAAREVDGTILAVTQETSATNPASSTFLFPLIGNERAMTDTVPETQYIKPLGSMTWPLTATEDTMTVYISSQGELHLFHSYVWDNTYRKAVEVTPGNRSGIMHATLDRYNAGCMMAYAGNTLTAISHNNYGNHTLGNHGVLYQHTMLGDSAWNPSILLNRSLKNLTGRDSTTPFMVIDFEFRNLDDRLAFLAVLWRDPDDSLLATDSTAGLVSLFAFDGAAFSHLATTATDSALVNRPSPYTGKIGPDLRLLHNDQNPESPVIVLNRNGASTVFQFAHGALERKFRTTIPEGHPSFQLGNSPPPWMAWFKGALYQATMSDPVLYRSAGDGGAAPFAGGAGDAQTKFTMLASTGGKLLVGISKLEETPYYHHTAELVAFH